MKFFEKKYRQLRWALQPRAFKEERLEKLSLILDAVSPEISQVIRDYNITLGYDSDLIGSGTRAQFCGIADAPLISFNPQTDFFKQARLALHEGFHAWQHTRLGFIGFGAVLHRAALDLHSSLLLTRVLEGGAYAYADGVFGIIAEVAAETMILHGKISVHVSPDIEEKPSEVADSFMKAQKILAPYDRERLLQHHILNRHRLLTPYTEAAMQPEQRLSMGEMRKIMHVRPDLQSPAYLTNISDDDLEEKIMSHVSPDIRKAEKLITEFRQATQERRVSPSECRTAVAEIDKCVVLAVRGAPCAP